MGRVYHEVLLIACLLACVLAVVCNAELHRAKVPVKTGHHGHAKTKNRNLDESEIEKTNVDYHHPYTSKKNKLHLGHTSETWIYSIISAVLVGLSGIFPLLVIPLESGKALRNGAPLDKLHMLLSFAVGGLLGDVFLHLLPEAWAHINAGDHRTQTTVGLWVLSGVISFMLIEKIFPDRDTETEDTIQKTDTSPTQGQRLCSECQHKGTDPHRPIPHSAAVDSNTDSNNYPRHSDCMNGCHLTSNGRSTNGLLRQCAVRYEDAPHARNVVTKQHIKTCGWLNLFANAIDNFTHGLAVAGSYCVGTKTGVLTTLAILLHELPHEVGDFAILLRSGFDRWQAAKAQLITASGALIGALTALVAESAQEAGNRTAWILPFTAGGFIYIGLVSVVPELLKENNWRESLKQLLLLCSGVTVMALVTFLSD